MANSGVLGGGGYQGRYLEFAWALVSQDIASNTSTIYWRVTVVGGSSSYYYHHRDYTDAFGEVLVNSNSRTKRYKGDLANGYKTIQHDVNGNASFGAHVIAAIYTSSVNEDVSTSWSLPTIPRQAHITNLPASFNDEENPWFDYTNPANWELKAWLEPNPNGPHLCERTFRHTGGRYTWDLSEAERKQLRQACKGNSCTIRIGLYSNGTTWASFHDRTFIIKDPMPMTGTPTWQSTNHLDLVNTDTVIKGYSSIAVTVPKATPVKEAMIKQYKVIIGDKVVTKPDEGIFEIENVSDSIIKVYVEDSRGNTVEKILNISDYRQYTLPVITTLSLSRLKGGIGSNVTLSYKGIFWNNTFGKASNGVTAQYYYKQQGASTWIQGFTDITPKVFHSDEFNGEYEIKGDLEASGFDTSKNYDFKLVITDKLVSAEKTTILSSGIPNMAIHRNGVAFGAFYDSEVGGPLQVEGKDIAKIMNDLYKWEMIGYGNAGKDTTIRIEKPFNEILLTVGPNGLASDNQRVLASTVIPSSHLDYNSSDSDGYHQVFYSTTYRGGLNKIGENSYVIKSSAGALVRVYIR
ncbi:hypothetical protein IMSAGC017_02344 [Thomasclavelia cocleata]|uniref:Uncharacterized protein n=1 Tax=Thomasclavelia cocleata TaxID=69824 RepID=A0A829ZEA5_9FIRM|nr:hypothetical protein [Thomasclavelia cocleata]GFI42297.1 hypothetical protein IMSAGC017_02344 [Thomasclavelia cocleata]